MKRLSPKKTLLRFAAENPSVLALNKNRNIHPSKSCSIFNSTRNVLTERMSGYAQVVVWSSLYHEESEVKFRLYESVAADLKHLHRELKQFWSELKLFWKGELWKRYKPRCQFEGDTGKTSRAEHERRRFSVVLWLLSSLSELFGLLHFITIRHDKIESLTADQIKRPMSRREEINL